MKGPWRVAVEGRDEVAAYATEISALRTALEIAKNQQRFVRVLYQTEDGERLIEVYSVSPHGLVTVLPSGFRYVNIRDMRSVAGERAVSFATAVDWDRAGG